LNFFFIEWSITSPLIIINIGRVLHIKLYKYFLLSMATVAMTFFGYLAHSLPRSDAFGSFAAGAACYVFVIVFLSFVYYRRTTSQNSGTDGCIRSPGAPLTLRTVRRLIISMSIAWSLYPVCFLLYLCELLTTDITAVIFVVLDILSKGIFTSILLGYYDAISRQDTFLRFLVEPPVARVTPSPPSPARLHAKTTPPIQIVFDEL
jgi:bacteriorhodopsin